MPRKEVFTKEKILQGAYETVKKGGWKGCTSRSVGDQIKCSTQPIYNHFKSMEHLRQDLVDRIEAECKLQLSEEQLDSNKFMNVALTYIEFIKQEPHLSEILKESGNCFVQLEKKETYVDLLASFSEDLDSGITEEVREKLFRKTWVTVVGLGELQMLKTPKENKKFILELKRGLEQTALNTKFV